MERENLLGITEFKEVLLHNLSFTEEFYYDNENEINTLVSNLYNFYYHKDVKSISSLASIVLITMGAFLNDNYEE